jgi:hypothetical protein
MSTYVVYSKALYIHFTEIGIFGTQIYHLVTLLSTQYVGMPLKKGYPGWGANPGPLNIIYFLIFATLPLSHSGSPHTRCDL